jgi:3-oxoacyl-[acyl-carrier protein] reductase
MLPRRRGHIINISSVNAIRGHRGITVYSAVKAGIDGFTRSLARELGDRGILVNSIAPGYLRTDMTSEMSEAQIDKIVRRTPLGRLGTIDDIVGAVRFLMSPAARFITGQTLVVDGGLTC